MSSGSTTTAPAEPASASTPPPPREARCCSMPLLWHAGQWVHLKDKTPCVADQIVHSRG